MGDEPLTHPKNPFKKSDILHGQIAVQTSNNLSLVSELSISELKNITEVSSTKLENLAAVEVPTRCKYLSWTLLNRSEQIPVAASRT